MQLLNFQVLNYRSVQDSGIIQVAPRTVLVGRNESGKTNILLALQSLNPPGGLKPLSLVKDFPRSRSPAEFSEALPVLKSRWQLSAAEQAELAALFPRAAPVQELVINRLYRAGRQIHLVGLPPLAVNREASERQTRSFERGFKHLLKDLTDKSVIDKAGRALNILSHELTTGLDDAVEWAGRVLRVASGFRKSCEPLRLVLPDNVQSQLQALEEHAKDIAGDEGLYQKALIWVAQKLPIFVYLNDYPQLKGHQNLRTFLQHAEKNALDEAEQNFARLCQVAELDPLELAKHLGTDHQHRQLLTNRAGAILTQTLRKLWRDRPLKVRFNLDAEHFDTLISDPSDVYDVEVNLDERSRGFKWFFSFYITFAADTAAGLAQNAIVLLDEPGMHLHAGVQGDLLHHFIQDFPNPVIFTTHSPFMVPVDECDALRTVVLHGQLGTQVHNRPSGDAKTLFPIQTALGYQLLQQLNRAATTVLLLETVSDFIYLQAVYSYLQAQATQAWPALTLFPAGEAYALAQTVAQLHTAHWPLRVLVSANHPQAKQPGLIPLPQGDSLEDLLEPSVFAQLVSSSHAEVLAGRILYPDHSLPGLRARYQGALQAMHLDFQAERVAHQFARQLAQQPSAVLPATSQARFVALLTAITRTDPF